ncbi:MAG: 30S ribosomal protein S9, partial [Patescibacteria group bacterium]
MPKKVKKNYTHARGRRKLASARVRLFKGEGDSMVNGMLIGKYFEGDRAKREWMKPFEATGVVG